jgi:hypothetical protein
MGLRWLAFGARSLLLFVERALTPLDLRWFGVSSFSTFRKFTLVAASATKHLF